MQLMRRWTSASWSSIVVVMVVLKSSLLFVLSDSTKIRGRRCQRSASRGRGSASSGGRGARSQPQLVRGGGVAAGVGELGEPKQRCRARILGEGDEEDLARLAGALRAQPLEDLPVLPSGGARVTAPRSYAGELDACMGRGQRRLGRVRSGE